MIHNTQVTAVAEAGRVVIPIRPFYLMLGALVLLVLGAALAFNTYRQYQAVFLKTQDVANAIREQALQRTTLFLGQSRDLLSNLSQDSESKRQLTEHCPDVFTELTRIQPVYSNLAVLDADGHVLCDAKARTRGQAPDPDVVTDFSRLARTGQFTIGKPVQNSFSERWIARLLYPLKDDSGKLVGAIFLSIDLLNMDMTGTAKDMPQKSLVGIVNGDGILVARSEGGLLRIGQPANSETAKTVLSLREGSVRGIDFLGSDRLFSFAPVPESDWILFASVDMDGIVAPVTRLALQRLAVFAALLIAASGVLMMLSRRTKQQRTG